MAPLWYHYWLGYWQKVSANLGFEVSDLNQNRGFGLTLMCSWIHTNFTLFFSTRYNLKYVAIEAKAEKERKESESVGSSQDGHDDDLDDLNDDFAEVKCLKL